MSRAFTGAARLAWPVLLGLVVALTLTPAFAEVQTSADAYETADPRAITFRIVVSGDPVESARLVYRIQNPDGVVGGDIAAEVPGSGTGALEATLVTNGASGGTDAYIPIGSEISYSWELTARGGATTRTEQQSFVFLDGRHQWQSHTEDEVTVYWYDDEQVAMLALQSTIDSIADMEDLLATEVPYPIRVVVWPRESEGEMAQRSRGTTFDSQVITGGSRVAPDLLHIYDALGSFTDVARHEAAHLVTKVAGDGTFTRIPAWLDEGTAVYSQSSPGGYEQAVDFAIRTDSTLRIRNMTAASNQADVVNLFYGQSWAVVKYLVDTYGSEDFAALYASIKAGNATDDALREVYGVDQDGLYNEWRESVGLPPIEYAPVGPSATAAASGTRPPLSLPTSVSAGGSQSTATGSTSTPAPDSAGAAVEESSSNMMVGIIVGVVTLLLAGGIGAVGLRLMRSKK